MDTVLVRGVGDVGPLLLPLLLSDLLRGMLVVPFAMHAATVLFVAKLVIVGREFHLESFKGYLIHTIRGKFVFVVVVGEVGLR